MRELVAMATLAAVTAACGRDHAATASRPRSANIVLITIDTLRADRIGAGVAPALDALARSSLWFTQARSAVPLTLPSHATILTGLLPPAHGVRENGVDILDPRHQSVATILRANGYRTAAFVGAFVLDRRFGLAQGFDVYDDRIPRDPAATDRLEAERPAEAVVDAALAWLDTGPAAGVRHPALDTRLAAPVFVWIHLYDPHAPYNPPTRFLRSPSGSREERYNGEVAYADSQIARVFAFLRERGLMETTLVVVAGDHGEGLGEHGENTHGMLLYDSTLRVPLILSAPGTIAKQIGNVVSLADLAPTMIAAAGIEPSRELSGRDLLSPRFLEAPAEAYAETNYPRVAGWSPIQALTDGRWKMIRGGGGLEIYDLRNDPHETLDASATQTAVAAAMTGRVDAIRASGASDASTRTISAEAQERLRALGYVAASTSPASSQGASNPAPNIADWNAFELSLSIVSSRPAEATAMLARLAGRHPDAPVFQSTYARALKESGRVDAALEVYRRAVGRWPTDPVLLHDLAVAAREAGRRDEARKAELAAAALSPDSALARNGLGLLAIDEGRAEDATAEFNRATSLDPGNASYWANLGNARRAAGDAAGAEQAYGRALAIDPRSTDAANGRGVLLVEARRPAEAVVWFERALSAQPDFVEARLNLGIALQESGDVKRAEDAFREVLAAPGGHEREKDAARKLLAARRATR